MSDQSTSSGAEQPSDQPTGDSGRLRDQFAALGEWLDQMVSSQEAQDARRRLTQAADEVETRVREAQIGERLEHSLNDLTQQVKQAGESVRGKDISESLNQAFTTVQQDVQQALNSPRGQELRTKLATMLRDWSTALEGKRSDKGNGTPS